MSIPLVPFAGRMSYCLIRCLHMVLAHHGQNYAPAWLECVSGQAGTVSCSGTSCVTTAKIGAV